VEHPLGDRTLAEEHGGDSILFLHAVGEREPDRERQPAADDGVAAVQARRGVEQVHRAAAAAAAAFSLAVHLGHDRVRRNASRERMTVLAIRGDDRIVRGERVDGANGDRLLTDVQVQEAADLELAIEIGAPFLEAPDAHHVAQQRERELAWKRDRLDHRVVHARGLIESSCMVMLPPPMSTCPLRAGPSRVPSAAAA
jgi:hypothetical protein